ncbi:O-succinylbenzoate synthase [Microbacterium sp. 1.5R]|uniref:o-succinylbenzoate synthase n=1 Tax=unclassified Microbacterium TaxID=2609290 RepID=UPI00069EC39E|nr:MULTISPECIES: o-succinylbenzoate synthase [unclassified Microbacterium]AKV87641.1 O-succinylbenzoate synthase [Microbacterium sp. CGR1]APH44165.1 O-succinylbenzoate synthase [Microbacterium sp. 1.5R]
MLPPLADLLGSARVVSLPMHTRFRGVDKREALLVEGPEGWAEFSPFVEYDDLESATWLAAAIDFAWRTQPEPLRERIGVNATIPAVEAAQVAEVLARFAGCRTAKVKVAEPGQTLADDIARVRAVREAMGPEGRIRVDANGLWNVDEAEHAVHALNEFDLEYVEQPCATVPELAELRTRVKYMGIPVAADESIRKSSDPLAVAREKAADLLVIKAQPLGGITHALQIITAAGLPVVVSSALDTAIGLSQGAALAAALPTLDYDCGLGTASLFLDDVADLRPVDGSIPAARVTPDPDALARLAASDDRRDWWLDRLARCYAVLDAR